MAYNYTKLNEVTLVDSAVAPNLLIEGLIDLYLNS